VSKPIVPQMPFVWPEPRVSSGVDNYETALPFERAALSVFGVVSAIDAKAVNWMEGYLADSTETKLRLVISIHPTCRTSKVDLHDLLRLVERHCDRAAFKVFPEASLLDRSSNLLCLCGPDGDAAVSVVPTENMGFAPASPSQANLASVVTAATFEACRKWFDYLWGIAGPLRPDVATSMPNLVLPEGDIEAARLWEDYRRRCLAHESATEPPVRATVDPESGELLPRYSFALADGARWMPKQAIPLFEAALTAANDDAKKLLSQTLGDDIQAFLASQRERIRSDAQRMYEAYHPGGKIPDNAVTNILDELKTRLDRTKADKLIPKVAYSPVAFNPSQKSEWSSPWGQAFALLKRIAEFPREAMTNRFFWQGIRTDEDALIKAMNVAGDHLVEEYGGRKAKQRAEVELDLIKQLEDASGDALAKCRALWALLDHDRERGCGGRAYRRARHQDAIDRNKGVAHGEHWKPTGHVREGSRLRRRQAPESAAQGRGRIALHQPPDRPGQCAR